MRRLGRLIAIAAGVVLAMPGGSLPAFAAKSSPKTPAAAAQAPAPAPSTGPGTGTASVGITTEAKHALILEADTGVVLLDKMADERMPPASMSKIMTAYVVFDLLKQGRAKLDDMLPVSEKAWRLGGSKMFVPIGGRIKIEDLIRGMIIQSGNDSCLVLAEGLAGSEEAFVEMMNEEAKKIGLKDSHFANVDGLPNPDHWMTARDLVKLALLTMKNFPEYYHFYSEMEFLFNGIKQGNRNPLLYKNYGADGLKTGHTDEAGYSLTASVSRDKRRIIMVLGGLSTMKARSQESDRLIEWAFREFANYKLFSAGDKVDDADVWLGAEGKVPMTVTQDLVVTLPRKSRKDMKVSVVYNRWVKAPITKGTEIGKLVVTTPDTQPVEAPLVAASDVDRMGAVGRVATVAGYLVWGARR